MYRIQDSGQSKWPDEISAPTVRDIAILAKVSIPRFPPHPRLAPVETLVSADKRPVRLLFW
jgi:hypothetical protein